MKRILFLFGALLFGAGMFISENAWAQTSNNSLPFAYDFPDETDFNKHWVTNDADGNGSTWMWQKTDAQTHNGAAVISYNGPSFGKPETMYYATPFHLVPGLYNLSYKFKTGTYEDTYEAVWGTAPEFLTALRTYDEIKTDNEWVRVWINFTVETEGDYLIGFRAYYTDGSDMFIDSVKLQPDNRDPYVMDFEYCEDFAIDNFSPAWTVYDGDGSEIYGFSGLSFPHEEEAFAFIAFNPAVCKPDEEGWMTPYNGERFGACFAAKSGQNDDWLISPKLLMPSQGANINFKAQTYMDYGLEKFEVWVSENTNAIADFEQVGETTEAPLDEWGDFTFDLSKYNGKEIYVAIRCVSEDIFVFMIDDIRVSKPEPPAPTKYTVTVATLPEEGGSITGAGEYEEGTEVLITAVPNEGYAFVQWSDGNTDNPRTVTVTEDATYTAVFAKINTAVEDIATEGFSAYVVEGTIHCSAEAFQIFSIGGTNITNQNGSLPVGVYVVVATQGSKKVVVK